MDAVGTPRSSAMPCWGEQMFAPTGNIGAQNMTSAPYHRDELLI